MKVVNVISWKMQHAPGLGYYGDLEAVANSGENVANLIQIAGLYVKWPASLGAPPDDALVASWEAEYDATIDLEKKRAAAVKALEDKAWQDALDAALNDPNAPQAVKDFKAVKK